MQIILLWLCRSTKKGERPNRQKYIGTIFLIFLSIEWQKTYPIYILYSQLRARRALILFKDVPLRTRRALLMYKVYGESALLVSTEHHWTALTPFWLTVDDIQGGPERMQRFWLLISWTSSMKQLFCISFCRTFIFQENDTMIINFGYGVWILALF